MTNVIVLSDLSLFVCKVGKIVLPSLITTTLYDYFNRIGAHQRILFLVRKREVFVFKFMINLTQEKKKQLVDFGKLIQFNGIPALQSQFKYTI